MMIDLIVKQIMANIPQTTQLFNSTTETKTCTFQSNTITIAGLEDGDYVLSGGIDNGATVGCINTIHSFVGGVTTTDCFFGDIASNQDLTVQQVNVGTAVKRDLAMEIFNDTKVPNLLIVYWSSTESTKGDYQYTESEDGYKQNKVNFGVLMKIDTEQMEALGEFDVLDKVIANSVLSTGNDDATLIKFENIKDRFYAGDDYCVDFGFSYLEDASLNDILRDRIKGYNIELETLTI